MTVSYSRNIPDEIILSSSSKKLSDFIIVYDSLSVYLSCALASSYRITFLSSFTFLVIMDRQCTPEKNATDLYNI